MLSRIPDAWRLPAVLLVALATHATYLSNGFTSRDHGDIEAGRAVRPLTTVPAAFLERWGDTGFYRPLVTVVHSVDHAVYGLWAPGYHVTNVLLHVAFVGVVWLFAGRFAGLTPVERMIAAVVVAVHPVSWIIVGGITYRQELLVAVFTLLAVVFHARARERPSWPRDLAVVFVLACALFSKETAVVWFPAVVLLWEMAQTRRQRPRLLILESATIVGYLLLRAIAVPDRWRVEPLELRAPEAIGTRLLAMGRLLRELLLPRLPSLSDATPIVSLAVPAAVATLAFLIVGAVAAARWGPHRAAGRTMLFTAVALAPALHLVPLPRFSSPHYAHLATVGLGMLAALALVRWAPQAGHWGRAARAAAGVWLAVAAAVTLAGGSRFEDDLTLFGPEVQADPGFVEGHSELGLYFARRGDVSRASAAFEEALRPRPGVIAYRDDVMIFVNLASVRLSQGRIGEADALLARAEALAPASQAEGIAFNRAAVAARRGDDEAVVRLLWPFGPSSTRPETLMLLARSLGRQGRREDAVQTLRKALPVVDAAQRNRLEQLLASTGR